MKKFEVTIKDDGETTKRIQPALTARQAAKLVRLFYYYGREDMRISARSIR